MTKMMGCRNIPDPFHYRRPGVSVPGDAVTTFLYRLENLKMNSPKPIKFTENQINGLKAGLNQIAQGCLTLIKVLSMSQIPHTDKFPGGRNSDSENT
jgi:hypothetical protein